MEYLSQEALSRKGCVTLPRTRMDNVAPAQTVCTSSRCNSFLYSSAVSNLRIRQHAPAGEAVLEDAATRVGTEVALDPGSNRYSIGHKPQHPPVSPSEHTNHHL